MNKVVIRVAQKTADAYEIPLGPVTLVLAHTASGLVGCGAFDVGALDRFSYPAAKVSGVKTIEELLAGAVQDANAAAHQRGVRVGMTGREALEKM